MVDTIGIMNRNIIAELVHSVQNGSRTIKPSIRIRILSTPHIRHTYQCSLSLNKLFWCSIQLRNTIGCDRLSNIFLLDRTITSQQPPQVHIINRIIVHVCEPVGSISYRIHCSEPHGLGTIVTVAVVVKELVCDSRFPLLSYAYSTPTPTLPQVFSKLSSCQSPQYSIHPFLIPMPATCSGYLPDAQW